MRAGTITGSSSPIDTSDDCGHPSRRLVSNTPWWRGSDEVVELSTLDDPIGGDSTSGRPCADPRRSEARSRRLRCCTSQMHDQGFTAADVLRPAGADGPRHRCRRRTRASRPPRCWPNEGQGCCRAAVPSVDQQVSVMDRLPQGGEADPSGEAASKSNFDICELTAG